MQSPTDAFVPMHVRFYYMLSATYYNIEPICVQTRSIWHFTIVMEVGQLPQLHEKLGGSRAPRARSSSSIARSELLLLGVLCLCMVIGNEERWFITWG